MREYEMIYVLKADSSDEIVERVQGKVDRVMEEFGGVVLRREAWGKKKLAYDIQKNGKGQFFFLSYAGGGDLNKELTRLFRIDDAVLRALPIKVADDVDVEARLAEASAAPPPPRQERADEDDDDDDEDDG